MIFHKKGLKILEWNFQSISHEKKKKWFDYERKPLKN
jgi:hypothetical protein